MRSLILQLAVSLDGYIEDRNGAFDWCFTDQDYGLNELLEGMDALVMGRKSWELVQQMGDAAQLPPMSVYVCSNTLSEVAAPAQLLRGDAAEQVARLKQAPGKNIWLWGGAALTTALVDAGLVDEIALAVHPVLLGGGKPLFSDLARRVPLRLLHTKAWDTGLVSLTYAPLKNK
ncbi:MAG: dihydrofolate reductase [Chitinophagaceae bacterium]|nr:MAG: dihydrofolate reductase [Chitinophagaceae bacterium]